MELSAETLVTCVVPAFNEAALIEESVAAIDDFWASRSQRFRLIVVDDGSSDDTARLIASLAEARPSVEAAGYRPNRGKGAAVRTGVAAASAEGILYVVDADMPFAVEDHLRVVAEVDDASPVVYGSRITASGRQAASLLRRLASAALGILNRALLGIRIRDNQCGLKAYRADIAQRAFALNDIDGFGFDLFTTAYLGRHGIPIGTVPVELLPERRASTVGVVRVSVRMLRDVFAVRRRVRRLPIDPDLRYG